MSSDTGHVRSPLCRTTVVDAAVELLEQQGYEALTMRRLADHLGVVPMALYRHVNDKLDLEGAVVDRAMMRVTLPEPDAHWRDAMTALSGEIRDNLLRLPGLIAPLLARPNLGINAMTIRELTIGILRRAGFDGRDAERDTALLLLYTIGFVALEIPRRANGYHADGSADPELEEQFATLPPAMFPNTVELGTRPGEFVSDAQFAFGLERILDGMERSLERAATCTPAGPEPTGYARRRGETRRSGRAPHASDGVG
jgi:AcrR family transcriptional regulator